MKIIIVGAGQVGRTLAENLSGEANDITVLDNDQTKLTELQNKLDIRTIHGHGSYPRVLRQAGAEDADMLIAVTGVDEINMVICQLAYTLFGVDRKIGRIRSHEFLTEKNLFQERSIPIDVLINPERVVTDQIIRLIERPGSLQVLDFAAGRVQLVAMKAHSGGHLVGQALRTLREHMPTVDSRVAAIFRHNKPILPEGNTVIEAGDEVFFIAAYNDIPLVMSELRRNEPAYYRIMIAVGLGLDQVTAWSAVGATINNLGPGLGKVALHYGELDNSAKWILCFSMLLGRLEVFTFLVLFTPTFWRR